MNTQERVRARVKAWLNEEHQSYDWLANQLGVSKALIGHMLAGKRTMQPHHMEQIAHLMGTSVSKLLAQDDQGQVTVHLRGTLSNRRSKRELDNVVFAVEDYLGLQEQLRP